ncbi:MAG: ABC transporter transmembrane domain-containing protein [Polynucleobacter sp.]|uniref:ABC transporter transmembrane domain-containing protein n=1 Tax=Polynucleobacter sp. TaxID=2029855 RepID=UPI002717E003|nr:ABC transporter transmembrane domain-containing protein [Polynucleobacter sp.]MDO9013972.1 ABC transporter transmembrane domain-containing protein [Polynucleobacter sp.]MDP3122352.1 ABC transporter transmembrane domain-containing protein [Polynucleobacter sp.]
MASKLNSLTRWLRDYRVLSRYRIQWILACLFLLLAAAATLAVPLAFRGVVDTGLTSDAIDRQFIYLLLLAAVLAVMTASRYYMMSWLGERVVADIRQRVFENVLRQSPRYFETLQTGEVLSRLTSDTTLVQTLVGSSISIALRSLVMLIGGMTMMLVTSAWLAGVMIVLLAIIVLPLWALGRRVRKMSRISQDKVADTSAMAGEVLNAITTVQAFTREPHEQQRFNAAVETAFGEAKKRITMRSVLTAMAIVMSFGVIVFVLWIGAQQVTAGVMTLGELTQFVLYAVLIAGSIGALSETWGDLQRAAGAMERLVELMQAPPDLVYGNASASQEPISSPPPSSSVEQVEAVAFQDVSFAYSSRPDFMAINHLSFAVPQGARYALVGPSGAGKSTLFAMLLRFYAPTAGQIAILGQDITHWPVSELRNLIGIVPQEPIIFASSAMENIRYGKLDASDEEVIAAAKTAHADGFISALPEGYGSFLGERGVRLSGGQKQRISIARAILKNPPILLLDEATSALDAESEREVQLALDSVLPGRTSLTIAHRLATVLRADSILVLEEGRLVEQGSHADLIQQGGLYARLADLQFA